MHRCARRSNCHQLYRDRLDHGEELQSERSVVTLQKPPVTFGDNEGRGDEIRRFTEQASEQRVIGIRTVGESNQGRCVNVGL